MSLSFPPRVFAGYPVAGTLNSPGINALDGSGTNFSSSTSLTGWSNVTGGSLNGTVSSGPFMTIAFGYGTANEEKIRCVYNSSTLQFTIVERGYEGGTARTWTAGELFVLVWTATEAAELNAVTQMLYTLLTNSGTTLTPQPIAVGTGTGSIGAAPKAAAIDHDHKISPSTLNSFLSGASVSAALGSNVTIGAAQVTAGTLPVGVVASRQWRDTGTGASPASITGITGYSKYIILVQSEWTSGATSGDNQLYVTANSVQSRSIYGRSFAVGSHSSASLVATGTDFSVSSASTSWNAGVSVNNISGTSNAHTITVIGMN